MKIKFYLSNQKCCFKRMNIPYAMWKLKERYHKTCTALFIDKIEEEK